MQAASRSEARDEARQLITLAGVVAALALLAGTAVSDRAAAEEGVDAADGAGVPTACLDGCAGENNQADPAVTEPRQVRGPAAFELRRAEARPGKVFFAGKRDATVDYVFEGSTTDVQITVIRRDTDQVVSEFVEQAREPLVEHTATWDGRDQQGALVERGKLKFRIGPPGGPSQATPESRFDLFSHKFPVRAPHTYGDGYGAGRGHKGQDVFASCGSRLEAARAGEVQVKAFQGSGAGYYVVIDGRSDNHDYVYMHLKKPASVREGENVKTGETIGKVGASGNATGCHLHFEYWRDDWFNGGKALRSVTRKLKRWDSWS